MREVLGPSTDGLKRTKVRGYNLLMGTKQARCQTLAMLGPNNNVMQAGELSLQTAQLGLQLADAPEALQCKRHNPDSKHTLIQVGHPPGMSNQNTMYP